MPDLERLQRGIDARQQELHRVADILAGRAQKVSILAASCKVLLIVLGAISATRGTADQLVLIDATDKMVFYTAIGVVVAAVAGLDAAFKFEGHAAEFRLMAADCQATLRAVDTTWQTEIGGGFAQDPASAAKQLLAVQDSKLADIQQQAAKAGFNITLQIRDLYREERVYLA
jgi:hypothetical protein